MSKAKDDKFLKLKSHFDKHVNIADPVNGPEFLEEVSVFIHAICLSSDYNISLVLQAFSTLIFAMQINKHYSSNLKPEMTLERLQLLATAKVQPLYRIRWLKIWNSSAGSRAALRFPLTGTTDKEFEAWLHRACFWAEVRQANYSVKFYFSFISFLIE